MSFSKQRIEVGNTYKDLIKSGINIDRDSFINWVMQLYDCSYADAKDGLDDGINLLFMEQQANETPNQDKVLDDMVQGLEENSKLSSEERNIVEVFSDGKEI